MERPPRLVIFDFDGTLFNTQQAIQQALVATFQTLLPGTEVPEAAIHSLIGSGKGLEDVIIALHPDPSSLDRNEWVATYRQFYAKDAQRLVTPYEGAQQVLETLHSRRIPTAIISNKSTKAVLASLEHFDLLQYVPTDLIVGDTTPGATRKPDTASYFGVLLPILQSNYASGPIDVKDVLVVGDTEADLQFAANFGGRSVWCRYGFGDPYKCAAVKPHFTIDSMGELNGLFQGALDS